MRCPTPWRAIKVKRTPSSRPIVTGPEGSPKGLETAISCASSRPMPSASPEPPKMPMCQRSGFSACKDACHDDVDGVLAIAVTQLLGQRVLVEAVLEHQSCREEPVHGAGDREVK